MGKLTKSSRKASDFLDSEEEPDYHEKLDFYSPGENKNKFWHIWTYGRYVIRRYGRQGTNGQTVVHEDHNSYSARQEARDLYWSKMDKGYVKDQTTILDHIARKL
jgi:predicted DNA-binding WGR domain protein